MGDCTDPKYARSHPAECWQLKHVKATLSQGKRCGGEERTYKLPDSPELKTAVTKSLKRVQSKRLRTKPAARVRRVRMRVRRAR